MRPILTLLICAFAMLVGLPVAHAQMPLVGKTILARSYFVTCNSLLSNPCHFRTANAPGVMIYYSRDGSVFIHTDAEGGFLLKYGDQHATATQGKTSMSIQIDEWQPRLRFTITGIVPGEHQVVFSTRYSFEFGASGECRIRDYSYVMKTNNRLADIRDMRAGGCVIHNGRITWPQQDSQWPQY